MHPILFRIGDFYIGTYGLFVAIGMLAGVFLAASRARRLGIDPNLVLDAAFLIIIASMLGARLTYIAINFPDFLKQPREYLFSRTGFVFAGGMIAGALAGVWFVRRRKAPLWRFADCAGLAIPLGHAFGRIGCFFAGCCWGKRCALPWGVSFPAVYGPHGEAMGFVFEEQRELGLLPEGAVRALPVHPTQLYECAALFGIFFFLLWLWKRRRFDGQIFLAYLALYSVARFLIEFVRGDAERGIYLDLSTSQWISLGLIAAAGWLWAKRRNQPMETAAGIADSSAMREKSVPQAIKPPDA